MSTPENVKFSAAQLAFLRASGDVFQEGNVTYLTIDLDLLEERGPTGVRTDLDTKIDQLRQALTVSGAQPDSKGRLSIPLAHIVEAGFPIASASNPNQWTGLTAQSRAARALGYKAKVEASVRDGAISLVLHLTTMTPKELDTFDRKAREAEEKAKAKKKAGSAPVSEASVAGSDVELDVPEDEGDSDDDTEVSDDEDENQASA